jgi:hypothetical protein
MSRNPTLLAICLLGLNLSIDPSSAAGQASTSASDSTAPAASDSQPAAADSTRAPSDSVTLPGIGSDTARGRDTTRGTDTTTAGDSTIGRDTTSKRSTVSIEPADSILSAACTGAPTVARDLLVIVFAPEASGEDRSAVAQTLGAKLLGPVSSAEPGAYYLRVPSGGGEFGLRAAADELIQLAPVRQVGSRACPPPTPRNPG